MWNLAHLNAVIKHESNMIWIHNFADEQQIRS